MAHPALVASHQPVVRAQRHPRSVRADALRFVRHMEHCCELAAAAADEPERAAEYLVGALNDLAPLILRLRHDLARVTALAVTFVTLTGSA